MIIQQKNAHGFTLLELLVIIAILGILALVALPSTKPYFANMTLRIATNTIKQQLILAKTRAMGNPNVHCGVYFNTSASPNQTQPFMDTTNLYQYDSIADLKYMPVYSMPKNITFTVNGGTTNDRVIVFRGDGSAKGAVTQIIVTVTVTGRGGTFTKSKTISVLPSTGRIKVQ